VAGSARQRPLGLTVELVRSALFVQGAVAMAPASVRFRWHKALAL
jgi:hypothetical protein